MLPNSRRWRDAFQPVRDWVNACALCVAAEVQRAYRDFRFQRGVVTYADQVALAVALLRHPHVVRRIRERNYRVILDEAQDTDPQQFLVLLEITRPPEATGLWREERQAPRGRAISAWWAIFSSPSIVSRPISPLSRAA